jgi:hypothetical protein
MARMRRRIGRVALTVAAAGVLGATAAASAGADSIARPPGAIDGRGWELVSQADKNRSQPSLGVQMSADGDHVFYGVTGGVPGSSAGTRSRLLATRTSSGWTSVSALPPRLEMYGDTYFATLANADLTAWIATAEAGLGGASDTPDSSLVRLDFAGHQSLIHTFPVSFGGSGIELVGSDDLRHLLAEVPEPIDASHQPGTWNVYDFGGATAQLVSRMPGTNLAPACGVDVVDGFAVSYDMSTGQHRVSTDGSKAFFGTRGDRAGCGDPLELYLRDATAGRTTLVSGPPVAGRTDYGYDAFVQAAADGSWVVYRTATSLEAVDDADGFSDDEDLYRWTPGTGNTCLTCVVAHAALYTPASATGAVVSTDGSHAYFTSPERLADAPAAGDVTAPNLYVLRGGTVHWITRTDDSGITSQPADGGYLTPDGNVLIFRSADAGLDTLSGRANGGWKQWYRYDDTGETITCLSCPSDPATASVPQELGTSAQAVRLPIRAATDDGDAVFFPTFDPLVPEDRNGGLDLYEWHDGTVKLITSGTQPYGSALPTFYGASADGRDVLFSDSAQLTADAQGDPSFKIYDARVGGGFEPPQAPPPGCDGDGCRGAETAPPGLGDIDSELTRGLGNVTPAPIPAFRVLRVSRAERVRLARTGRVDLRVRAGAAGRVSAVAKARLGKHVRVVARARSALRRVGVAKLALRLSAAARAHLRRAGRLRVAVQVRYSATGAIRRVTLKLRRTARHGR